LTITIPSPRSRWPRQFPPPRQGFTRQVAKAEPRAGGRSARERHRGEEIDGEAATRKQTIVQSAHFFHFAQHDWRKASQRAHRPQTRLTARIARIIRITNQHFISCSNVLVIVLSSMSCYSVCTSQILRPLSSHTVIVSKIYVLIQKYEVV
jgi:hypothetical protein